MVVSADNLDESITQVFQFLDKSNDGIVDRKEIRRFLSKVCGHSNKKLKLQESRVVMNALDSDRDGQITLAEFEKAFRHMGIDEASDTVATMVDVFKAYKATRATATSDQATKIMHIFEGLAAEETGHLSPTNQ